MSKKFKITRPHAQVKRRKANETGKVSTTLKFFLVALTAICFRWSTAFGTYSGFKILMYGDFEAQRHWMEITVNLPLNEWYIHTNRNDLMYWGLDYPPLTAYHSFLFGKLAQYFNVSWVELYKSRVFFTSCYAYSKSLPSHMHLLFLFILLYPGNILIDHGHFQFNCVSLGLYIWTCTLLHWNYDIAAAVFFVFSLSFKQMELYHAPAIFCYLLGKCLYSPLKKGLIKFFSLAFVVCFTFGLTWYPFITDIEQFGAVISRIFPFNRGLYEDKVANIWCSLSVFIKWKEIVSIQNMVCICAACTLICILPGCITLLTNPTVENFNRCSLMSSLSFFLFSYHVHEKSILIPAVSALLTLKSPTLTIFTFLLTSAISLFPLCVKDGLTVAFFSLTFMFYCLIVGTFVTSLSKNESIFEFLWKILFHASFWGAECSAGHADFFENEESEIISTMSNLQDTDDLTINYNYSYPQIYIPQHRRFNIVKGIFKSMSESKIIESKFSPYERNIAKQFFKLYCIARNGSGVKNDCGDCRKSRPRNNAERLILNEECEDGKKSNFLFEALRIWLDKWKQRLKQQPCMQYCTANEQKKKKKSALDCFDEEWIDEEKSSDAAMLNAMLLHGPCGSGKTSIVHAMATLCGFQVIEINTNSLRTQRLLEDVLLEATLSHRVQLNFQSEKLHNPAIAENMPEMRAWWIKGKASNQSRKRKSDDIRHFFQNSFSSNEKKSSNIQSCSKYKSTDNAVTEKVQFKRKNEERTKLCQSSTELHSNLCTVILIDDVDVLPDNREKNFLPSVQKFILESNIPIIMTSESEEILSSFPSVNVKEFSLRRPCIEKLVFHLKLILLANNFHIDDDELLQFAEYHQNDWRRCLMNLHFLYEHHVPVDNVQTSNSQTVRENHFTKPISIEERLEKLEHLIIFSENYENEEIINSLSFNDTADVVCKNFKQLQAILKQCPSILYCATITDITVDYLSFMRRMAVSCDDVSGQLDSGLRKRRKTLPYLRRIGIDIEKEHYNRCWLQKVCFNCTLLSLFIIACFYVLPVFQT
ncbi:3-glucosyltransferase,Dolichyl pyrophosphate Man9GlcNAc2 alpha-1 [Trichinella pseudospiralis]